MTSSFLLISRLSLSLCNIQLAKQKNKTLLKQLKRIYSDYFNFHHLTFNTLLQSVLLLKALFDLSIKTQMVRIIVIVLLISLPFNFYGQQGYELKIITSFPYGLHEVELDMDGNYVLCGGNSSTHIAKMDSDGNVLWDKIPYEGSFGFYGHTGMDVDSSNNIYYVDMRPPFHRFVYKLSPDGDSIKMRGLGAFPGQSTWTNDVEVVNSNKVLVTKTADPAYPWHYYCILELLDSDLNNIAGWEDSWMLGGRITVDQEQNIFVNGNLEDDGYVGKPRFWVFDTLTNFQWSPSWDFACIGNVILLNDGSHLFSGFRDNGSLNLSRYTSNGIQLTWNEYFNFNSMTFVDIIPINDTLCLTAMATYLDQKIGLLITNYNGDSLHTQYIPLPDSSVINWQRLKLFRHDCSFSCITDVLTGNKGGAILYLQMNFDSLEYLMPPSVPSPQAEFTYEQEVNIVHFTDISSHQEFIESWHWDFGDGYNSEEQHPTHTYTSSGAFKVCLTLTSQNSDTSIYCDTIHSALGIKEHMMTSQLSVNHNPKGYVVIENSAPNNIDCHVRIIDEAGIVRLERNILVFAPKSKYQIDLHALIPGFYAVQVISGRLAVSRKIVLQ